MLLIAGCGAPTGIRAKNIGKTSIVDFSEIDVILEYTTVSDTEHTARLDYGTNWTVIDISPDTRDPNVWNPQEVATLFFTPSPAMKTGSTGTSHRIAIRAGPLRVHAISEKNGMKLPSLAWAF